VRACAGEMHVNISQDGRNALRRFSQESLLYRKNCRAPESVQNAGTHYVQACAIEMHVNISHEPILTEIYRKKCRPQQPIGPHVVQACPAEMHFNIFARAT